MARIVSTGATLSSPEFRNKKLKEKRRRVILWSTGVTLILVLIVFLLRMERFAISNIKVEGARVITEEEVARNVNATLSESYLWIIPKSNALIYPRITVARNLRQEFPRFSTVSLSLTGAKDLLVSVSERDPYALYCSTALRPENASDCFFLDSEGFVFDEAPAFSGNVYFIYALENPLSNPEGSQFISAQDFQELSQFIEGLKNFALDPVAVEVGEKETEVFLKSGAKVLWKTEDDLTRLSSNLESFLSSEPVKEDPNFRENISILDLRTENKVFYRFHE